MTKRLSTRDRLLVEGMALFARNGYRATTVGDIEAAAGLTPRAGAFYRHFPSKEALFEACLDRWVSDVREFGGVFDVLPLDDVRAELTVIARGTLQLLSRQADLFRFVARDAEQFPRLAAEIHDQLVARGYRQFTAVLRRVLAGRRVPAGDLAAIAAAALGALVHYKEDEALYGAPPADADEERFVRVWVDAWASYLERRLTGD